MAYFAFEYNIYTNKDIDQHTFVSSELIHKFAHYKFLLCVCCALLCSFAS